MTSQAGKMLVGKIKQYRKAIKYLDGCGEITFEKIQKASEIAGADVSESELRTWWEQADLILPSEGQPGGKEFVRFQLRKTMEEAISTFADLAKKMGASESEVQGGGCFIATACYGSQTADEVVLLQRFRDEHLTRSAIGRCVVSTYYALSPQLAAFIGRHPVLRSFVRTGVVDPIVRIIKALQ